MPNLSTQDRVAVVSATTQFNLLLQLDEVWTEAVTAGPPASGHGAGTWIDQLRTLVATMADLLPRVEESVSKLHDLVKSYDGEANAALRALLWDKELNENIREDLRMWVGRRRIGQVWSTAEENLARWPDEVEQLRQQLSILEGGQAVAGDLSLGFRCGAANGILTGGILLIPTGVAGGVAALSVGALAAAAGFATGGIGVLLAGTALYWARKNQC